MSFLVSRQIHWHDGFHHVQQQPVLLPLAGPTSNNVTIANINVNVNVNIVTLSAALDATMATSTRRDTRVKCSTSVASAVLWPWRQRIALASRLCHETLASRVHFRGPPPGPSRWCATSGFSVGSLALALGRGFARNQSPQQKKHQP
jgi:hypothetical protein